MEVRNGYVARDSRSLHFPRRGKSTSEARRMGVFQSEAAPVFPRRRHEGGFVLKRPHPVRFAHRLPPAGEVKFEWCRLQGDNLLRSGVAIFVARGHASRALPARMVRTHEYPRFRNINLSMIDHISIA